MIDLNLNDPDGFQRIWRKRMRSTLRLSITAQLVTLLVCVPSMFWSAFRMRDTRTAMACVTVVMASAIAYLCVHELLRDLKYWKKWR